ncbi:MAG: LptF/LptG family permease [Bacteroidota bacterium]
MTTFDWHILKRLTLGYVLMVGLLILFFIVLHYVESIDDFLDRGAEMKAVFTVYYPNYIPDIVRQISPLALFLTAIYVTAKLSQTLQLSALNAGGVSLMRLMRPYALAGLLLTGFMFWFNGWIVPHTNQVYLTFEDQYLKKSSSQLDRSELHRQNAPRSFVTVGYYNDNNDTATRVSLQTFSEDNELMSRYDAEQMRWNDSLRIWQLEKVVYRAWPLEAVEDRDFSQGSWPVVREIAQLDTALNVLPSFFARTENDVDKMNIPEAAFHVEQLRLVGASDMGKPTVDYYKKFSYPLANLILVFIGVALASKRRRGGQTVQIGLGLAVAFVYLALMLLTEPFGYAGTLSPLLTAVLPHAVFAVFALLLVFRSR